jgi:hypothetical protein
MEKQRALEEVQKYYYILLEISLLAKK